MTNNFQTISAAYEENRSLLINYVCKRINDIEEAADIVQEVFVRLLSYDLVSEATVKSLCFTIANNLVIDYLRRHYKRQEVLSYVCEQEKQQYSLTPEQIATFHDLAEQEHCIMHRLAPATARVYEMTQMQDMTIDEISQSLSISRRTVECHQFKARKFVRTEMRKII